MNNYGIWIDHHEAKIFKFGAEDMIESTVKHKAHDGHVNKNDLQAFYHSVVSAVNDATEIFIMGPGTAKDEFKHHCEKHDPKIAKNIVGTQVVKDHPRTSQVVEITRKFFAHHHQWTKNY
jgi:stalled ribosome rescue protein Dom34